MRFKITEEAKEAVVRHLSKEGLLDIRIERDNDWFTIHGIYDGLRVIELDKQQIYDGNSLTITGMKMVLDLEE